jgi:hypothetical protein
MAVSQAMIDTIKSLVSEYDEFDVVVAFMVVLGMQQLKMLLVLTYWLVFTNAQVPNFVLPYSHTWPKFLPTNIKFLVHL